MRRYHYVESALDDVWLLNGFKVETFGSYGEAVGVQNEQALWRLLGRNIARQDRRMNGQELRLLRALLDWSQVGLGEQLGYTDHQMVAKWEKARHDPIPIQADTFVRACYLESIKEKPMIARVSAGGWPSWRTERPRLPAGVCCAGTTPENGRRRNCRPK